MKKRTAWILVAGVAAVAIGAAAVGALALMLRGAGSGGDSASWTGSNGFLYLNLNDEIPEQSPGGELPSFFEKRPAPLRVLVESLDRAAGDPKVTSVVLRVSLLPDVGWGRVQELRDAIVRFRKSGKPAYAHLEFCGNQEYYLATACTKIYAVPTAIMDVTGLRTETTFFAKHARQARSRGAVRGRREVQERAEPVHGDGLHARRTASRWKRSSTASTANTWPACSRAATRRAEQVQAIVDNGPYDGQQALKAGLVDELVYEDQLRERLKDAHRRSPPASTRAERAGSASTAGRRSRSSTPSATSSPARARAVPSAARSPARTRWRRRCARRARIRTSRPSSCASTARAAPAPRPT